MEQTFHTGTQKILKVLYISLIIQTVIALFFMGFTIYGKVTSAYPNAKLTLYDGPKTMKTSADTQVSVNGNKLFVYETNVNNTHTWVSDGNVQLSKTPVTYFDFDGKAVIEINLPNMKENITSCTVTPSANGIVPKISGKTIRFTVDHPGFYTVEINGSVDRAIHIFANPLEQNIPNPKDPNVVYIGPGEWNVNTITLKDNQTLYISGGAVVHGMVRSNVAENITVRGRGIIDGSVNQSWIMDGQTAKVPIDFRSSKNVNVEGIILLDSNAWVFNCYQLQKANISNVKLISARPNGDGFTLQSCQDVTVKNCFVRTWDDSLVVKNYGTSTNNITFDNINVWTDLAQSCEIGYETNKGEQPNAKITNVTFKNITVLHNFHKPVLSIHNSDDALVQGIHYQNIVVEDAEMGEGDAGTNNQLIDFGVVSSAWSTTAQRGSIKDITIDGVTVLKGKTPPSSISGYDAEHMIENVTIKNLTILGKKIKSADDGKFLVDSYAKNVKFE